MKSLDDIKKEYEAASVRADDAYKEYRRLGQEQDMLRYVMEHYDVFVKSGIVDIEY